jgi:hypothetical protein
MPQTLNLSAMNTLGEIDTHTYMSEVGHVPLDVRNG